MFRPTTHLKMPVDQWLSMLEFQNTQPEINQYQWLSEHGSMTQRFLKAGSTSLNVNVITSKHQLPHQEEQLFLNIKNRKRIYVREVIMEVDNKPWMFGRTIIPAQTLKGAGGQLKLLGNKPLGKVLFNNRLSPRIFIEVAQITKAHCLYPDFIIKEYTNDLWARRSLFLFQGLPLMVQEVFLPDCPFQAPK